jgi:hypothetical protein
MSRSDPPRRWNCDFGAKTKSGAWLRERLRRSSFPRPRSEKSFIYISPILEDLKNESCEKKACILNFCLVKDHKKAKILKNNPVTTLQLSIEWGYFDGNCGKYSGD